MADFVPVEHPVGKETVEVSSKFLELSLRVLPEHGLSIGSGTSLAVSLILTVPVQGGACQNTLELFVSPMNVPLWGLVPAVLLQEYVIESPG